MKQKDQNTINESDNFNAHKTIPSIHPHNYALIWAVIFIIIIAVSGFVGWYLIKESEKFDDEISSGFMIETQRLSNRFIQSLRKKIDGMEGVNVKNEIINLSGYNDFSLDYPEGWHVLENRSNPNYLSISINEKPVILADGVWYPTISVVDRPIPEDISYDELFESYSSLLENVDVSEIEVDGIIFTGIFGSLIPGEYAPTPPESVYVGSYKDELGNIRVIEFSAFSREEEVKEILEDLVLSYRIVDKE